MIIRYLIGLVVVAATLSSTAVNAADVDLRGTWDVVATQGSTNYPSTWLVGSEGDNVFGVSQWACCPGFRVDRLTGVIDGTRIEIARHIIKQGSTSGTQLYIGTVTGLTASGTWSGLGGSGNWTAKIRR